MKFVNMKTAFALALCLAVCAGAPAGVSASANSALLEWRGSYSAGSAVLDENCPVNVESELLTFNIPHFPETYYEDTEESRNKFLEYSGSVTARYEFYNPADYGVNMTLAFPFGNNPDYVYFYGGFDDTVKYSVTANGEKTQTCLRHTLQRGDFDTETDVGRLVDGFKEDDFYSPDLPVYVYRFQIGGIPYNDDYSVHAELDIPEDGGRKIISTANGYEYGDGCKISWFVRNGDDITIYSVGKPMAEGEFDFRFYYYHGRFNIKKTISGRAERNPEKDGLISFRQLALSFRGEDSAVSETDWYNASVDSLNLNGHNGGYVGYYSLNLEYMLMRWYEYSLYIPAGGRLTNEVTAPLYPGINGYYSPNIYSYEYLLSPAKNWAGFGSLEVRVNTPYYITENPFGFERAEYGYYYRSDGLPDGEINFTLCEAENPVRSRSGCNGYVIAYLILPLTFFIFIEGVTAGIVFLILYIVKKSKTKRK